MTHYQKAIDFFNHKEFKKAIPLFKKVILKMKNNEAQMEYFNSYYYLGMCEMELAKIENDKTLMLEAISSFSSAANSLKEDLSLNSNSALNKIKECLETYSHITTTKIAFTAMPSEE